MMESVRIPITQYLAMEHRTVCRHQMKRHQVKPIVLKVPLNHLAMFQIREKEKHIQQRK